MTGGNTQQDNCPYDRPRHQAMRPNQPNEEGAMRGGTGRSREEWAGAQKSTEQEGCDKRLRYNEWRRRDERERLGTRKCESQPNERGATRGGGVMRGRCVGRGRGEGASGPLVSVYQKFVLLFSWKTRMLLW